MKHEDLYRFLHSIKGMAPSIGRSDLGSIAYELLQPLDETEERDWTQESWESYVSPLMNKVISKHLMISKGLWSKGCG